MKGRGIISEPGGAEQLAERVRVLYRLARALSLMGERSVGGVTEQQYPAPAPPRQEGQIGQGPEVHVPLDVTDEIEDARIPRVLSEDSERLPRCRRGTAGGRRPGRQAIRLVHGEQVDRRPAIKSVADGVRARSAPALQRLRVRQVLGTSGWY